MSGAQALGKMTKFTKLYHPETNHNLSKIGCAMKLSTLSSEPPDTSLLRAPLHFRIDNPCTLLRGLFPSANPLLSNLNLL